MPAPESCSIAPFYRSHFDDLFEPDERIALLTRKRKARKAPAKSIFRLLFAGGATKFSSPHQQFT
jgi:hypothetical protein